MANDPRFEVYPQMQAVETLDAAESEPTGEFGWRFRDANGQITFIGGEGFTHREDAHRAAEGAVYDVLRLVLGPRIGLDAHVPIVDVDE